MLHLIPAIKVLTEKPDHFTSDSIFYDATKLDGRLAAALAKLPFSNEGAPVEIQIAGTEGEGYTLDILPREIRITADSAAGAFYAIQTLRQIFANKEIPCLHAEDKPDFPYRGFYHDVTRGKIPTVETVKDLIDRMAYFKLNSLQLYVEHVFEFEQTKDLQPLTGYLTGKELEEIDAYCKENFISFIPSLSTFGHMYEILQQPKYHHLRVLRDYKESENFWYARMAHHTIDPLQEESFELVKSLIDQYAPHFSAAEFNICGDETFDLKNHPREDLDRGKLYIDFVQKIIAHLKEKEKTVMMWADILLKHPETIDSLPEDTLFLNWNYRQFPPEEQIKALASLNRPQIVCPGTTTWSRLCENVEVEESNIALMAEYGYQYGAKGILNTNWGDWGNPCSIELAAYGLAIGAEKGWSVNTPIDANFRATADHVVYGKEGSLKRLCALSEIQSTLPWNEFCRAYFNRRYKNEIATNISQETLLKARENSQSILRELPQSDDPYRKEMILCAQGLWSMAELWGVLAGFETPRTADTEGWLKAYSAAWREKNKDSELYKIVDMFTYLNNL